jgi:hypothetical protein
MGGKPLGFPPMNLLPFKKAPLRGGFFVTNEYRTYKAIDHLPEEV